MPFKTVYTKTYDNNGSTAGKAPNDNGTYVESEQAMVLDNNGELTKTDYIF